MNDELRVQEVADTDLRIEVTEPGRFEVRLRDVRVTVVRTALGATVEASVDGGPTRGMSVPATPTPLDDEYVSTEVISSARVGGDKNARIAVCPCCGSHDVSVNALNGRRNRCRACGKRYLAEVEERRKPLDDEYLATDAPVGVTITGGMVCPGCGYRTTVLINGRCDRCRSSR